MGIRLLVCGGGNGAHTFAGIAASRAGIEAVTVLTLFANEADKWTTTMEECGQFLVTFHDKYYSKLKLNPFKVTNDPSVVVPGCNVIVLTVPAFAHAQYLQALKAHIMPGTVLVGCPGRAGFEFAVREMLADIATQCYLVTLESLPWVCRITQYGKSVEISTTKSSLSGALRGCNNTTDIDPIHMLQTCLGEHPELKITGHILGITLMPTNGALHPTILYGAWRDWDGRPVEESPLFYTGLDEVTANILSEISDEIMSIAKGIMQQRQHVDLTNVTPIYEWYLKCYRHDIVDSTTLFSCIKTNAAYEGLTHPMKMTESGHVVDFGHRYLQEDIPYGLVVIKGIAEIAGVQKPSIDRIITWSQQVMGKEYLIGAELTGKDVNSSRAPQAYGITTLDALLGLK